MCQTSHTARSSELSRMSIVYFKQSRMRAQLDKWFKDEYISKKRPLNFHVNGNHTNDQIKMRPQIGLRDRLKAEPIKIVLKALDIAHETEQLRTNLSKLKPYWGHDAINDDCYMYCWIHFSFSRMREGSRFIWGSGGEAVFAESCLGVRKRSQPFASVRNRLCDRRKALHSGQRIRAGPDSV